MDTLHIANKGRILDTLKRFYFYRETQRDNQINDKANLIIIKLDVFEGNICE